MYALRQACVWSENGELAASGGVVIPTRTPPCARPHAHASPHTTHYSAAMRTASSALTSLVLAATSLLLVQPATLLRWHRQLFRGYWHRRSRAVAPAHRPPLAPETDALIRELAVAMTVAPARCASWIAATPTPLAPA